MNIKTCTICHISKPISDFYKHKTGKYGVSSRCAKCHNKFVMKKYYSNHQKSLKKSKLRYKRNSDVFKKLAKKYQQGLKIEAIKAYGSQCICCGERDSDKLTVDHTFNDGKAEREKAKAGSRHGAGFYRKLKILKYPKERYQLLCFNCNLKKAFNKGILPSGFQDIKIYTFSEYINVNS